MQLSKNTNFLFLRTVQSLILYANFMGTAILYFAALGFLFDAF
jgi:hypothetical protein